MAMRLVHPRAMTLEQADCLQLAVATRSRQATREELVESIVARPQSIERGLAVYERDVAVPGAGRIDLIGADAAGMLVLCHICETLDAATLAEVVHQAEWAMAHRELLGRLCGDIAPQGVRSWIVCDGCEANARALLARMGEGAPTIFTHRVVPLAGDRWIVLQRENPSSACYPQDVPGVSSTSVSIGDTDRNAGTGYPAPTRGNDIKLRSLLTEEEIGAFCQEEEDEEITQRVPLALIDEEEGENE